MRVIVPIIMAVWASCVSANFIQSQHVNHTQKAEVACWKSGVTYTLTFYLTANQDRIDNVYMVHSADSSQTTAQAFSSITGVLAGSGSTGDPYTFTLIGLGQLPVVPVFLDSLSENVMFGYVTPPDTVSVNVMSKAFYEAPFLDQVVFPNDVLYTASCNFTEIADETITSGQINVAGDIRETPYSVTESAVLDVINENGESVGLQSVTLGDNISLQVDINEPTHASGVYVHSCTLCDTADCSSISIVFINDQGCAVQNHISSFVKSTKGAATNPFESFMLNNQNSLHFRCKVNYCYDPTDLRCSDFCSFNGRRKRQADFNSTQAVEVRDVFTTLRVTFRGEGVASSTGELTAISSPERHVSLRTNTALMVSVITLTSLLFIGLCVVVVFRLKIKPNGDENTTNNHIQP